MTASVNNLTGKVNAGTPQMHQIGGRLVALGRLDRRVAFGDPTNCGRPVSVFSLRTRAGLQLDPTAGEGHPTPKETIDATNT